MNRQANSSTYAPWGAGLIALLVCVPVAPAAEPGLEPVQTIVLKGKAGNLDHLALDAKRGRLYLANKANNTLDVVDLKDGKLLKQVRDQGGIQGIAYAPDLDRVFVGLGKDGFCNIFSGEDDKLLKTIKFTDDADNVRYHAPTHLVYVAHAEKQLGVIDAQTFATKAEIDLPGDAEAFQLETGRPRLYVNIPSANQVALIDTDKNEVVKTYPLAAAKNNVALALDEANHRLFVGCEKEPLLVILDTESGKEVGSVPIAGETDDVVYDAPRKRIYASGGDGAIAVVKQADADHYEAAGKIETVKGAKTSLLDPATGRYYLAVPRQPGKEGPEIRVYQAKP
jgi:DNA-binding beta-propeller fold protein YncE